MIDYDYEEENKYELQPLRYEKREGGLSSPLSASGRTRPVASSMLIMAAKPHLY